MINLTNKDQSSYLKLNDNEVRLHVKYAHAYAFREIKNLTWEVDYFREKTARNWKSPKYVHPIF